MPDLYLLKSALRDLVRVKKLSAAIILAVLPALIALAWRLDGTRHDVDLHAAYDALEGALVYGFVLVLLSVVFATGVVTQEVEGKTISYLLTRPVPRWRILLDKFAAALIAIILTTWVASLLLALVTYGPADLGKSHLARDLAILPVGALAYGSLFLWIATFLNRPLLIGLLFAFGWEAWVPSLPGSFQKISLMVYLRALAPHPQPTGESADLNSFLANTLAPAAISHTLAHWVLTAIILLALGLAIVTFSHREYLAREDLD